MGVGRGGLAPARAGPRRHRADLAGLESGKADRATEHAIDHVDTIVRAVENAAAAIVLAVHSASGFPGYAATDRVPDRIAAMVYVDTAPGKGAHDPDFADAEKPLDWDAVSKEENLDGLSEAQLQRFRERAVPVPGNVLREGIELTNDARRDIPSTIIATGYSSEDYRKYAAETDMSWLAGIPELRNLSWIDLPTSHWPMWSKPRELAEIIGGIATERAPSE